MAAIGLKRIALTLAALLCSLLISSSVQAQDEPDVRAALGQVASALTASDPSGAMQPFSKTLPDYGKLRNYFTGLTNGFSIVNEIDILDQQGAQATVRWAMTLSSDGGNHSTRRVAEIHLRMSLEKKKWKVVEFSPISLFDPEQAQTPTKAGT